MSNYEPVLNSVGRAQPGVLQPAVLPYRDLLPALIDYRLEGTVRVYSTSINKPYIFIRVYIN